MLYDIHYLQFLMSIHKREQNKNVCNRQISKKFFNNLYIYISYKLTSNHKKILDKKIKSIQPLSHKIFLNAK